MRTLFQGADTSKCRSIVEWLRSVTAMFETRGFWAETATATPSSRINFFMLLVSCRTRLEVSIALRRDSTTETTRFPITSKRCKEIPVLRKQWQSKQKQKQ